MSGRESRPEEDRQFRVTLTLMLVLVLLVTGGFNVWRKATVPVPHDGLTIRDTAAGPTVTGVGPASPAALAGIETGDIVTGINGLTVATAVEFGRALAVSGHAPKSVYSLQRNGQSFNRVIAVDWRADWSLLYAVLALAGLAALLLGGVVGIFGRRTGESTLLALLCFTFAGVTLFSPTGSWDHFDILVNGLDDAGTLLLPVLLLALNLWFPAPGVRSRRLALAAAVTLSCGLALLFAVWYAGLLVRPGNPYTTTTMYSVLRRLVLGWLGLSFLLGGITAAVRRTRTADPIRRQQLLWLSLGPLLGGTPPLLLYFLPLLAGFQPAGWQALSLLALTLVPAAFGVAVRRYRLADAPLVFKQSMVYGLSSAVTLFTILLALAATARWLPALSNPRTPGGMVFWAVTAMVVSAIFFPRIRDSLARSADRLHFGERLDHRERLAAFDPFRLDPSLPPERLVEMFMDDVTLAMGIDTIRFLGPGEIPAGAAATAGTEVKPVQQNGRRCRVVQLDEPWEGCFQLLVMESAGGGQPLGAIAMGPSRGGALLGSQDLAALLPAAELLAMSLENSSLTSRLMEQQRLASIGRLAAGVAHEINTPLTGISSYTEMLLENGPETETEQEEMLKKIGLQAERAEKIVSSLLQFARQRGGTMVPVDLQRVIRQAVSLFEHQLKSGRVAFRLRQGEAPLTVTADAGQLQQVLINLMSNALAAMPEGGRLTITTEAADGNASVTVTDTGHGIFEPFFTTRPPGSGTGLGLSICYGIIRDHQGDISIDSRPGAGTVFTVTLPLVQPGADQ